MQKSLAAIVIVLLSCASALAGDIEANIKASLQKRRPDIKVDSVAKTPVPGIYEVYAGGQMYYTDETAHYILDGQLFDFERNVNLTDQRTAELEKELHKIQISTLPFDLAIKQVKGNGSRTLVIFTDPDCPFCRQLQHELESVNNLTVYYFLFPLVNLHPNASKMARAIWCAPDRSQAWLDYMLKNIPPKNDGSCDTPVATTLALGRKIKVDGTPAVFDGNGNFLPGTPTAQQIEQHFAQLQSRN